MQALIDKMPPRISVEVYRALYLLVKILQDFLNLYWPNAPDVPKKFEQELKHD